ncbi:MAG: PBP1A family penicillin-binding protein [Rhodospirillaceae bacterium]|nr:PBP1A family penicillin-binding protein [Rhodospirillaceae bacterium]
MARWFAIAVSVLLMGVFAVGAGLVYAFYTWGRGLPDHNQLATYEPAMATRLYGGDGRLVQEYAVESRIFVPIDAIPKRVIDAFLSAEDKTFYEHNGIDFAGLLRAILITNVERKLEGRRSVGASTITQQVAKNFLLSDEYSFTRKFREAIVAVRMEQTFTKDHILELYLNENYLGAGYGVAAAARNAFNKTLDELTVAEAAFIAGATQAPGRIMRDLAYGRERRDYVLDRMYEDGHISRAEAEAAKKEPLTFNRPSDNEAAVGAEFFAEEVRRDLQKTYGSDVLYKGGLVVRTSLNADYQAAAQKFLQQGLTIFDVRHGYRGVLAKLKPGEGLMEGLKAFKAPGGIPKEWSLAVVEKSAPDKASIILPDGTTGSIPLANLLWARQVKVNKENGDRSLGEVIKSAAQVLQPGDIIMVTHLDDAPAEVYNLRQFPDADGAVVAMDPHTGRVLAMTGGFAYARSQFNRATQALRQPGSAFKPFVYLAAMESDYTPSTLVLDAPFVADQGPGLPKWKPKNYTNEYLGLTTLRRGLEKSQNLMTVRLAQAVGMEKVADTSVRMGVYDQLPPFLSAALGSEVTTVIRLTTGYAMLVNGGKKITPSLIDRIQDRHGKTIFRRDQRVCPACRAETAAPASDVKPELADERAQVADPGAVYEVVHMMEGVVERGTGRTVAEVGKPLAGKTGTSNDSFDTWFVGFSPDLVVGVFVGHDEPRSLGPKETGGSVAAPIFREFMKVALKDKPSTPFRIPEGVTFVRVNLDTGKPAEPGDNKVILEAFKAGTSPFSQLTIMGQSDEDDALGPMNRQLPDQPAAGSIY